MTTKPGSQYRAIYDSPYDAFTNYMNILGDFINRVNNLYGGADNDEIEPLIATIKNQDDEISAKDKEIAKLREQLERYNPTVAVEKAPAEAKKVPAKETEIVEAKASVKKAVAIKAEKAPAKKAAKPATKKTSKK